MRLYKGAHYLGRYPFVRTCSRFFRASATMRSNYFSTSLVLACASAALAVPFASDSGILSKKADSTKVGYLAAYWKTDETGIFFALSTNDNPLQFNPVNGGEPLFVPTLGQKTVRDLSLVPGSGEEEGTKWYLLATDLNIEDVSNFPYNWPSCLWLTFRSTRRGMPQPPMARKPC